METLKIDEEEVTDKIVDFIRDMMKEAGFERAVIGLSGGVDSSSVAYIATRALGAHNVWGISMPYRTSSPMSAEDAKLVAENLGINFMTIEITDMVDAYFKMFPDADLLRRGNMMSRQRMTVLYDQSSALKALVLGCGNKTEILLGYCTLYGDTACAMMPLGDLYKTQVWALARYLGVPERIINKVPTADLWPGQSDEAELGFKYSEVDRLLYLMIDKKMTTEQIINEGFSESFIKQVSDRIKRNQYKRSLPPIPKINEL